MRSPAMVDLGGYIITNKHTSFTLAPWLKRPESLGSSSEACARQTARAEEVAKFQARGSRIKVRGGGDAGGTCIRVVICTEFGVQFLFPQNVKFLIAYRGIPLYLPVVPQHFRLPETHVSSTRQSGEFTGRFDPAGSNCPLKTMHL